MITAVSIFVLILLWSLKKKKIKYFVETQITKAQLNFIYSFLK